MFLTDSSLTEYFYFFVAGKCRYNKSYSYIEGESHHF